jgi:hypothetical protein
VPTVLHHADHRKGYELPALLTSTLLHKTRLLLMEPSSEFQNSQLEKNKKANFV